MPAVATTAALYALLDTSDAAHETTAAALDESGLPLVAMTPVLNDCLRLARRFLGHEVALRLLEAAVTGDFLWQPVTKADLQEAAVLLTAEKNLSPSAAISIAAAQRLGVTAMLCLEETARDVAAKQGLLVRP